MEGDEERSTRLEAEGAAHADAARRRAELLRQRLQEQQRREQVGKRMEHLPWAKPCILKLTKEQPHSTGAACVDSCHAAGGALGLLHLDSLPNATLQ